MSDFVNQAEPRMLAPVPSLNVRDGKALASSRDVAAMFGKNHSDVCRSIKNLVDEMGNGGISNFAEGYYTLPATGNQQHRKYEMDRDGFTLLAMGFTGKDALKFKLAYIAEFNRMESALRSPAVNLAHSIPTTYHEALRLAADLSEAKDRAEAEKAIAEAGGTQAEQTLAIAAPKAAALDLIADTSGSVSLTIAAKTVKMNPQHFIKTCIANSWIYRSGKQILAHQRKLSQGWFEHKEYSISPDRSVNHVRVTPKGLTKIAEALQVQIMA